MARARNIKPGFFKNEELADCSFETRLLFIGLWTLADREGRMQDRPRRIRAEIFPFDSVDIDRMLTELCSRKFLVRYEVDGEKYIAIKNFVKHQDPHYREKASDIPPPPGQQNEIVATNVTRTQRARILERDSYKCQSCGSEDHPCIDHIVPVSRGGDSSDENLQVLCLSCNTKKGNKIDSTQSEHRPELDSINERHARLIPDSLIPDSLIPDSRFTDTPPVAAAPSRSSCVSVRALVDLDVSQQVATDFLAIRKAKRAPLTQTALQGIRNQAEKAGITLENALRVCVERGWQSYKAEWDRDSSKKNSHDLSGKDWREGLNPDGSF